MSAAANAERIWQEYVTDSTFDQQYAFSLALACCRNYQRGTEPEPYQAVERRILGEQWIVTNPCTIKDIEVAGSW